MQGVPPIRASFGVGSRQTDTLVHIDFGLSLKLSTSKKSCREGVQRVPFIQYPILNFDGFTYFGER